MRFKGRNLKQRRFSGLTESKVVDASLEILVEFGWLMEQEIPTQGRHTKEYTAHPSIIA